MKKKEFLFAAIIIFLAGIFVFIYALSVAGFFNRHKLLVRALACNQCASHEVIMGSFKLSGQLPDSVDKPDVSQVFLTGISNPAESDYTKTYDYFIVTGKLMDVKRTVDDGPQYPVIAVTKWEDVNIANAWVYIGIILLLFFISFKVYRRFVNANKISILKSSIMANEDIPD